MSDPWVYRLVWRAVSRDTVIGHPGHALHRTTESVAAHARILRHEGVRNVRLERWQHGDWWDTQERRR